MNLSRLRLITFDVTNTLLKFRSEPGRQYGEIGAMYGVLCDKNALVASFRAHWHKMIQEHPNFGLQSGLGWEMWWKMVVTGTFKDAKFNVDERKLDAISSHLIEVYKTSACWQQCYGAQGLLSYLTNKNIPLGCISNLDPRLDTILTNNKLRHFFRFILSSYEVGAEKPDQKIFEEAMKQSRIDCLKPEECLHIGNTPLLDYYGAKNSGWNAILIHERSPDQLAKKYPEIDPNYVYSSLYNVHKQLITANEPKLLAKFNQTTSLS